MTVHFHKKFQKRYKKLRLSEQKQLWQRLDIFTIDCFHPTLNNHALQGKYIGYRSINVTGDLRAIYKLTNQNVYLFLTIDTHGHLYS
ncbi:MAG: type II toxin-antitoxin system mRNA interferase toxin, RelE/StbE family [Candidatus Uhrbacteria bacterium]|nr:type II toxin-antitoxin system mRNA interferase toxin, RelE/StbE family [Candidatus Uhrbacteria bacterium]